MKRFLDVCLATEMKPAFLSVHMRQLAPLALVSICAIAVVVAYLQALDYPFIDDDLIYITGNAKLQGLHLTELWRLFVEPYNPYEFLPLRDLSYWFDIALFGLTPSAFRAHNIILYLLCLPLVYVTTSSVWRYFRPLDAANAPWVSATVSALFALHPAHVEAVVWVSGRKDVLSTLFSILALWLAVSAKRDCGLSWPHAMAALAALLAAMFSKATAVTVAPVIALFWILFWRDTPATGRHPRTLLWPFASMLLAACVTTIFIANSTVKASAYFGVETIIRALAALGGLARLSITPENRHYFYPGLDAPYLSVMVAVGAAVLVVTLASGVSIIRKRSLGAFALFTFLLLCIPYMQLVPYVTGSITADRWLSLAVWPVVLLIVTLSWRLNAVLRTVVLFILALLWGFQSEERPRDWRSFGVLAEADARAYPGYYLTDFYSIFSIQLPQGMYREANETANRITIPEFRDVTLRLIKADYAVHIDAVTAGTPQQAMGLLAELGRDLKRRPVQAKWNPSIDNFWTRSRDMVRGEWIVLSKLFPDNVSVRYNGGVAYLINGDYESAATSFRIATESPQLPEAVRGIAFNNLGIALLNSGKAGEAEAPLRAALEQSPPDVRAYCILARAYKQTGRLDEAARAELGCRSRALADEAAQ